ncbi:hypothetical protein CGCF415_v010071 [Colletotrichum fructicola]|uniref:Uncharacterized protein n=1 Tax=Colletotrichum fructicola (strain Nara gc5) TaxID=1213859 RepID=A0A7J6IT85_COLFN|nr:uncharacterized protein CGMCC3_g8814 [Colletotrichum fructicola]KAF4479082.1 hypothetical protein CGGC5_v013015 [Colletotrichum fructicola Nara gc5]KAE9574987.1 hypothetical protein CGMCC3_g8814 [Colletotrichum fructicola]KAF4422854.1 hypothetical protein CFRS1_v001549 [Colletotrichum fructicola]KAF4900629.1 hypothetical protein CGCF415_v010071 [Colletotrichum fructicola]KAF4931908.1 hypothetical protein CGCF245_v010993 [Colletotrichum fructicola]
MQIERHALVVLARDHAAYGGVEAKGGEGQEGHKMYAVGGGKEAELLTGYKPLCLVISHSFVVVVAAGARL